MRIWGVDNYQWALVGSRYVERHLGSLVRAWGSPLCFPYPGPRTADTHWQSENWCSSPNTSPSNQPFNKYSRLDTQTSHQNTHEEWLIDKDVELSSKYSDLVKAITACLVCSKQYKTKGAWRFPSEFPTGEGLTNQLYWFAPSEWRVPNMPWFVWTQC